jgi:aconitate hydratase
VLKINLEGKLKPFVTAKDVILKVLQILTTKGNVGYIVEYSGSGIKNLSVPERATITNMGAELGVTTSIFPSDEITLAFMKAQGREKDWTELVADEGALYDKEITIDLGEINPMIALPHSPDNIKEVREVVGTTVDQVMIGSCTNSSYKDLYTVSKLLENRQVNKNVSFGVAPGSKQVLEMITANNLLNSIIAAGARLLESTCGFCIGMGQSPSSEAVSLRTSNRNFFGRSGTKSADIYLVSPETAVASALTGVITDPSDYFDENVKFEMPEKFITDDSLVIKPLSESRGSEIEIVKGPNIGNPPINKELEETIKTKVVLKVGDKITTDHIMPAGQYLKYRSNIEKYSEVVFLTTDENFAKNCKKNMQEGFGNVVVGGLSYGQGSSREHAAICPMYLGVRVVLVKSIERIHRANLINFGIIPLLFENQEDYDAISPGDELLLSDMISCLKNKKQIEIENRTKNEKYKVLGEFSDREIDYLVSGGKLNALKRK